MLTNNLEGFLWNLNLSYLMWTIPLPGIILPWCEPCFGLSGCCIHSCLPLGTLRISLMSTDIITALKTSWLWHSSLHSPIPFYQPWLELYSSQEMLLNFISVSASSSLFSAYLVLDSKPILGLGIIFTKMIKQRCMHQKAISCLSNLIVSDLSECWLSPYLWHFLIFHHNTLFCPLLLFWVLPSHQPHFTITALLV